MVFIKNQHHFVIKDITVVMSNTIPETSLCDAITNIYDKILLKTFINTNAKPYVKRLSVEFTTPWINLTP